MLVPGIVVSVPGRVKPKLPPTFGLFGSFSGTVIEPDPR
jgi:hypothetical protein